MGKDINFKWFQNGFKMVSNGFKVVGFKLVSK